MSIYFGEDKTKCMSFYTKQNLNKIGSLDIRYDIIQTKQYHSVTYLGCTLDENLSEYTMALKVFSKINCRRRLLYRKNGVFLLQSLRRLLYDALIQPHFYYTCSAWYPNLNNRLKSKLQILQNKCICFCLNLNSRTYVGHWIWDNIFTTNKWPIQQCISSMAFQCFNNLSPLYTNDLFKPAGQNTTTTRTSLFKLSQPLRKTSHRQNSLSYVAPSIWNKLPDFLKTTDSVNTYKHRVSKYFFSHNEQ